MKIGNIENDIKNIKQYINLVLYKGYCDCNELNVISRGRYCDGSKNVAYSMEHILAELEQKDKRIQELEEYISIAPNLDEMTATKFINIQREAYIRGKAEEQQRAEQIIYENYIPKQAVIDKMEELNKEIKSCDEIDAIFKIKQQQVLQELLEEIK